MDDLNHDDWQYLTDLLERTRVDVINGVLPPHRRGAEKRVNEMLTKVKARLAETAPAEQPANLEAS